MIQEHFRHRGILQALYVNLVSVRAIVQEDSVGRKKTTKESIKENLCLKLKLLFEGGVNMTARFCLQYYN